MTTTATPTLAEPRWILILLGALTFVSYLGFFAFAPTFIRAQIEQERQKTASSPDAPDPEILQAEADLMILNTRWQTGTTMIMGLIFIVLGILVPRYPLECTGMALAGYLGLIVLQAFLDSQTVLQAILVKAVTLFALTHALRVALRALGLARPAAPAPAPKS